MAEMDFTYAVARIRALELSLFSSATLEQLITAPTYDGAIAVLKEHGWGDPQEEETLDEILRTERERTWKTIRELSKDMTPFDVLSYQQLFHNLKAAIKVVCVDGAEKRQVFYQAPISGEEMVRIVKDKAFGDLPEYMEEAAKEAYDSMLHGRDGQICDVILDRAALLAIAEAGKKANEEVIRDYAEVLVAVSNIQIAVRCAKMNKGLDFMKRAMAPCDSLSLEGLQQAALRGVDAVREYLNGTDYQEASAELANSFSAFECWCDNRIIRAIKPQKYNPFSAGPLFAYILARENEIKMVRMILTGRQGELPEQVIRERMREMYV